MSFLTIGVTGFEPAASWSQTRRSSQAEPHPGKQKHYIIAGKKCQELLKSNFIEKKDKNS